MAALSGIVSTKLSCSPLEGARLRGGTACASALACSHSALPSYTAIKSKRGPPDPPPRWPVIAVRKPRVAAAAAVCSRYHVSTGNSCQVAPHCALSCARLFACLGSHARPDAPLCLPLPTRSCPYPLPTHTPHPPSSHRPPSLSGPRPDPTQAACPSPLIRVAQD